MIGKTQQAYSEKTFLGATLSTLGQYAQTYAGMRAYAFVYACVCVCVCVYVCMYVSISMYTPVTNIYRES